MKQTQKTNISFSFFAGILVILILLLSGAWYVFNQKIFVDPPAFTIKEKISAEEVDFHFSPPVQEILQKKIQLLTTLVKSPSFVTELKKMNEENSVIDISEIHKRDTTWKSQEGITPFMKTLMVNSLAKELIAFQEKHPEFMEIFITDKRGSNVAQTNKTSDYFQSDEDWWQQTVSDASFHGEIEYDASAKAEGIPLYFSIRDDSGEVIGVVKAVLDILEVKTLL